MIARAPMFRAFYGKDPGQTPATVSFNGARTGVLTHKRYDGTLALEAYGAEIVK